MCQNRLKQEIKEVFEANNGELTYEAVKSMEYLEMVFQEISRLHPSLPYLDRVCIQDYSTEPFGDFVIRKGTPIIIPICSIQRDSTYFPDPDTFNPDRFSKENKKNITPFTAMAFGAGPRKCVGKFIFILLLDLFFNLMISFSRRAFGNNAIKNWNNILAERSFL